MNKSIFHTNTSAVSELIGGTLIVIIAVVASVTIYTQMLPVPVPSPEPNVKLMGYITEDGTVIIEHMGGETIYSYEIFVSRLNDTNIYRFENSPWEIGERRIPPNASLLTEDDEIKITVYCIYNDGSRHVVFDGILKYEEILNNIPSLINPMLVSSLRTNTVDEDLICYNYSIEPTINAQTYIYNWMLNNGGSYNSFTRLLMPFDTNNPLKTKDYSGNDNNGTVFGPTWVSTGKIGGTYSYDGTDYISIPYCFNNNYINKITVESWIKTNMNAGTIVSFNRSNYWDLAISNGCIKWSTNASDATIDIHGSTNISDNVWHHVATTYDSSSGDCNIFVDGVLDKTDHAHISGQTLGSGNAQSGYIGKGTGRAMTEIIFSSSFETQNEKDNWNEHNHSSEEETWEMLFYDDFEGPNWGNWNDGGDDCSLYSGGSYAHQGSCAIELRDNSGWSSSTYSDYIAADASDYIKMSIDFWWMAQSMENGEDFYINYYDGSNLNRLKTIVIGTGEYSNNVFYHTVCYINETDYIFTDQASFTIQCDASSNMDLIYVDEIYINVSVGNRIDCDFNLRDSTDLTPRTDNYSIGGSGDFDPEYAAFNRTGIDISNYSDVTISVWYSYESTESEDEIGLYYLNGLIWTPIFEELNPQIGNGNQLNWTYVQSAIPDSIDTLFLQFWWSTSSANEFVAIDDLRVTGIPLSGEENFTGLIDELKIYNRVLSGEQIYQNYLYSKDGESAKSVIVAEETTLWETWKCIVIPNDSTQDDIEIISNILTIIPYPGGD
jgi:hypothetical protein